MNGRRRGGARRARTRIVWRRVVVEGLALACAAWWGRAATRPGARPLRVLVIRPDHLGDLLLTTPALGLLRAALPDAHVTALVGPWARPALEGRPEVDALATCAFPGFTREPPGMLLAPYVRLLAEARRLRQGASALTPEPPHPQSGRGGGGFDAALILRVDHWWGAALAACAGIPLRIGYGVPESRRLLTHALPPDFAQHSVWESWRVVAALLAVLGRPVPPGPPPTVRATPAPAGQAAATAWLTAQGVPPAAPLVAVHPGTGAAVKLWSAEGWAAVADAVAARLGARPVLTGSAAEAPLVAAVAARMQTPALAAAGALDWQGLAGLFARCRLVLGVDSGPLHLAAALDVPSVHIFGPTSPARFGPWGDPARHRVVRVPLPCSPCGNLLAPPCGARVAPACLRAVTPDAVVAAALAAVGAPAGATP